jgi:cytoskeletal protein CcmA (bactofilin family)
MTETKKAATQGGAEKMADSGETVTKTVIAEDMEITGTVKSGTEVQLDGKLNGDMNCSAKVTVGKKAQVKGNLSVQAITIKGQVNGNVTAKDRIELKSTSRVNGDIRAKRLTVEDGVTFVGKSEVNPSGPTSRPASESSATVVEPIEDEAFDDEDSKQSKKAATLFGRK